MGSGKDSLDSTELLPSDGCDASVLVGSQRCQRHEGPQRLVHAGTWMGGLPLANTGVRSRTASTGVPVPRGLLEPQMWMVRCGARQCLASRAGEEVETPRVGLAPARR